MTEHLPAKVAVAIISIIMLSVIIPAAIKLYRESRSESTAKDKS